MEFSAGQIAAVLGGELKGNANVMVRDVAPIEQAQACRADIVLASDPDADRIGVAVPKGDGSYELLNGNMTLTLLVWYLLKEWKRAGRIDGKQYVVKTVVTTELIPLLL